MIAALLLAGCSSVNPESPLAFVDPTGRHPDGWYEGHGRYSLPDGAPCTPCHGEGLSGGSVGVSCFLSDCHHQTPGEWSLPEEHGAAAKAGPEKGGFGSCRICHGSDLDGGAVNVSCSGSGCHAEGVPHPSNWWESGIDTYLHQAAPPTDPGNAHVCAACHLGGQNSPIDPPSPQSSGEPGCFNNTLCHALSHVAPFLGHELLAASRNDFDASCSVCHAISGTSPREDAPECVTCHINGSPYTLTGCRSCHGRPPSSGRHNKHSEAPCSACHQGAGSGSGLNHYYDNEVDVDFSVDNFTYSLDGKCSGSCHMGNETESHSDESW